MVKLTIRRVHPPLRRAAPARWETVDLHRLWSNTRAIPFDEIVLSLHRFLEYCALLRSVKTEFEIDDHKNQFDACLFFVRGGMPFFTYLNVTSLVWPRGTVFGGLNHALFPTTKFRRFVTGLRRKALSSRKTHIRLMIADEVESGSGMGRVLNELEEMMKNWNPAVPFDVHLTIYAIRRGSKSRMHPELRKVVGKREGDNPTPGGMLRVAIKHFAGFLPGYDNNELSGIKTLSKSTERQERYALVKRGGGFGRLAFRCPTKKRTMISVPVDKNGIAQALSMCAREWSADSERNLNAILSRAVASRGCDRCRRLYAKATGVAPSQ